jgi:hypothetical protein
MATCDEVCVTAFGKHYERAVHRCGSCKQAGLMFGRKPRTKSDNCKLKAVVERAINNGRF